jgi:hypothetical protein
MIWFACKQCGKRQQRPDAAAGSLVFCECGQGNRVPWESTVEPPASAPEPEPEPRLPYPPRQPRFGEFDEPERPYRRRWREPEVRDPGYCFNHQNVHYEKVCGDCREHFCNECLVAFRGQDLCAPCKNFRVAGVNRPLSMSGMAIVSLVLALLGLPLGFCLSISGVASMNLSSPGLGLFLHAIGLVVPITALVLGLLALREIDSNPRVGGRGLAITGASAAVMGVIWSVALIAVTAGRRFVE